MKFWDWILARGGADAVSRELGVTGHCVRIWLRGEGSPTMGMTAKLIRLSKNRLTFFDIYSASTKNLRGRNAKRSA